ncbi:hypothetical protein BO94DRAFT_543629 [Aspergillus sclerotioniger CBS 115572]|uniref:Uncharacterized protein n=1 Tax=Aspergillus sclerotioniger CBS 115572 TaxID=1450535 RepID=A0A317X5D5_9EURO|nr:hypothetical protein BO94DRAFT_543629 [Aspergillus sclerotioniger CBS 115572]PWY93411.1 hypothetical protein BO94DRAFT_543629 [Aspergillus sclerotioniger CBS 115572]
MTSEGKCVYHESRCQINISVSQIDHEIKKADQHGYTKVSDALKRLKAAWYALDSPDNLDLSSQTIEANRLETVHVELMSSSDHQDISAVTGEEIRLFRDSARSLSDQIRATEHPKSAQLAELSDAIKECYDAITEVAASSKGLRGILRWSPGVFVVRRIFQSRLMKARADFEAMKRGVEGNKQVQ